MIKFETKKIIDVGDWDALVEKTYGRPYSYQQQDGCKFRGMVSILVPYTYIDDYKNDTVPEEVNGIEMGVSFAAWLARSPEQKIPNQRNAYELELFWNRNFYPGIGMIINDLHASGLLPEGEYMINIDW